MKQGILPLPADLRMREAWERARLLPCRPGNGYTASGAKDDSRAPLAGWRWQDQALSLAEAGAHVDAGGNLGVVPGTVTTPGGIRLAVLDLDRGDVDAVAAEFPPLAVAATGRGGGAHLWFPDPDGPRRPGTWRHGPAGGDVRSIDGYVRVWDGEIAAVDAGLFTLPIAVGDLVDLRFPDHLVDGGPGEDLIGPDADARRAAARARYAEAEGLFYGALAALKAVHAHDLGATIGTRHARFRELVYRRAGRQRVTTAWIAREVARAWIGLPQRGDDRYTEDQAIRLFAWALAMRPIWLARPHRPRWLARQAERGRRRRGKAERGPVKASASPEGSNAALRPWEREGISRPTWYRRRKAAREAERARQQPALTFGEP